MQLHPLPGAIDYGQLAARESHALLLERTRARRPKTLAEVLQQASDDMDRQDRLELGLIAYLDGSPTGVRHPRKVFRRLLSGR